jgi:hypothetical protein
MYRFAVRSSVWRGRGELGWNGAIANRDSRANPDADADADACTYAYAYACSNSGTIVSR